MTLYSLNHVNRLCVGAVYYKQIRKSEQRPPLQLRTADLVPQSRTPLCPKAIARCKLKQDKRARARQPARNIEVLERGYVPSCHETQKYESKAMILTIYMKYPIHP